MSRTILIYALGGESHRAPSDTLPAYWGAIGAGAGGLLVGVQRTSDGALVCCSQDSLEPTTGEAKGVYEVSAAELRKLDAGTAFRATMLDRDNAAAERGDDTPWARPDQVPLYHPTLEEVLLLFARRTQLLLEPLAPGGDPASLVPEIVGLLERFDTESTVKIIGGGDVVQAAAEKPTVYRGAVGEDAASTQQRAADLGCAAAIADAANFAQGAGNGPPLIAAAGGDGLAPSPAQFARLEAHAAAIAARSVDACRDLIRSGQPAVEDSFSGTSLNRSKWVAGYSKANADTVIHQDDGLHITIAAGGQYSGAAALTAYAIPGAFDARIDFVVENPHQGTTFELAAIHVDPGYHHMDNSGLSRRSTNLTFDVHGAPPYASSERDEDNGFRIGWNNGPAVTEFVDHAAQSANIYNKYSRDVGDGAKDNPRGSLRLVRNGAVFNAYYRDKHNKAWVLSGSANVPTLAGEVYLRLGGKHWPKRGKTPPPNAFHFTNFRLFLI